MANKRMFSSDIVTSDAFLDMPTSTRELYFQLCMRADDDGFVNPKSIMRLLGASGDDIKVLVSKRFVLPFESGVVVIKHWLIHNLIRADLYKETLYKQEKGQLGLNENGAYTELREGVSTIQPVEAPKWLKIRRGELRTANGTHAVLRLGKDRIDKDSKEREAIKDRPLTPAEEARDFFEKGITYGEIKVAMSKSAPLTVVEKELEKFIFYWTEKNKSGTKQRWEQQKTFEVKRRLYTWFSRVREMNPKKGKMIV